MTQPHSRVDRFIVAALVIAAATEVILLVLPVFVGALIDTFELSSQQLGLLAALDLAGIACATLTGSWWLHRVNQRQLAVVALSLLCGINAMSLLVADPNVLIVVRFFAGIAAGAVYAVALHIIVRSGNAAKNGGWMVCGQVLVGALGVYVVPLLPLEYRLDAVFVYALIVTVIALVMVLYGFRHEGASEQAVELNTSGGLSFPVILCVAGTACYFLMAGGIWGYMERIAVEAGIDALEVSYALTVGYLVSLIGSFAAGVIGLRFGATGPFVLSGIGQVSCLWLLQGLLDYSDPAAAFFYINMVFQIFWSFIIGYQVAAFGLADPTGRYAALHGASMHVALTLGPLLGALLVGSGSFFQILPFGVGLLIACYGLFVWVSLLSRSAEPVHA